MLGNGKRGSLIRHLFFLSLLSVYTSAVVIDTDDRQDWFEIRDPQLRALARATALLVPKSYEYIDKMKAGYRWSKTVPFHGEEEGLHPTAMFYDQPSPGYCTGFLVSKDLLITAAHCFEKFECSKMDFIFDFYYRKEGVISRSIPEKNLASCKEALELNEKEDWALVRLNKAIFRRQYFKLRASGSLKAGTQLAMFGYPSGLPMKMADNARVMETNRNADEELYFEADLDSFGGNSGSPVLNLRTLEVEGINAVSFGEYEDHKELNPNTGKPYRWPRTFSSKDATPGWVLRATRFQKWVEKYW